MDRIKFAVACAGLGLSVLAIYLTYGLGVWDLYSPGPALFPVFAASVCGIMSIFVMHEAVQGANSEASLEWPARRRVILTITALWIFAFVLERIGFTLATTLLMMFMLLVVLRKPVLPSVATVAIAVGTMYGIFISWLGLALPRGPFGI